MGGPALSRIVRSPQAQEDLIDVWTYIAASNDVAADRLLDRVRAKLAALADSPGIGRPRSELASGLHSFTVRPYVLLYRQIDDGIELVRVLHGARDLGAVDFV